jgi:hypothetical protein
MSFPSPPIYTAAVVPPNVHRLLVSLGWYCNYGAPQTYSKATFGTEYHTWSEAVCMELLEFVEGMKT